MSWFRRIAPLLTLALFTATAGVTAAVANPPAPHEHYANHPIRVRPGATAAPAGVAPATLQVAYNFPTGITAGYGTTIAIVDAYNDPSAESDLGVFSTQFKLPTCTTANGCFTKVNQNGGTKYPRPDSGWALEISLDIQWAHAIAPGAKILLVEAASNSFTNLMAAEDYASTHAQYVSNSWGSSEFSGESAYDTHFNRGGVSYFVSSGDNGAPAGYPSASPNVISVGGTTLHFDSSGALTSETGWSSSGADAAPTKPPTPPRQTSANTPR